MNLISYLADSRGVVNSMQRIPTIAARFGISARKMERALVQYTDLAERYGTVPTLAVTANLLERYPGVFRRLDARGVELAIHGYVHTDYSRLDLDEQRAHLEKGLAAFARLGIGVTGFRCPYVRWNDESIAAAKQMGLEYGSNRSIAWDVVPRDNDISERSLVAYRKGLRLYGSEDASRAVGLPLFIDGLLDLPTSLPDDEALVDRLRARPDQREAIWRAILDETYARGELFTLILHHERVPLCRSALEATLSHTQGRTPPIWLAPMRDISEWWRRRAGHRLEVERLCDGHFRLAWPDDPDVTVVARGVEADGMQPWFGEWLALPGPRTVVRSREAPAIAVSRDTSPSLLRFLEEEGYAVERDCDSCTLSFEDWTEFGEADKRRVIDIIERSEAPLARIWRWPRGARSALSLTGDVDSMTLIDFLRRPLEV